jgi:TPP-dependent pyruvate/acetoin dehydrogenase alpha subunit
MGQEAVATGICSVLEPADQVAATYRGHVAALALGTDPERLLAEMLGRQTGICGGRAGSMNVVDREHGLLGCFGIVGGSIGAATGAALSLRRIQGVAVAFFGDGAVNQGYFHECLNFAAVNSLPVVYVCEDNGYGEFTPAGQVTAGEIVARPRAFGIPSITVDGQDVCAVREAAREAVDHARSGGGPAFVHAITYRYNDHARGDPIEYRPPGELEAWRARDPLDVAAARLIDEHGVSRVQLDELGAEVAAEAEAMRRAAMEAPAAEPGVPMSEFST